MRCLNFKIILPVVAVLCVVSAIVWARQRNPFRRIEFSLATPHYGKTKAIAVLPKPDARFPVVIYVHGARGPTPGPSEEGNAFREGNTLRQFAEMGMAAVGIEYNQTDQAAFDEQFLALQKFIQRQTWAQSNAVAWVGASLGAQRTMQFLLNHPEVQPQLLVRLGGGDLEIRNPKSEIRNDQGLESRNRSSRGDEAHSENWTPGVESADSQSLLTSAATTERADISVPRIRCPVLLVHGENDEVFPIKETTELAALLQTNGVAVQPHVLPETPHNFDPNFSLVIRETAEYCRANLPPTDYTATLRDCQLNDTERRRFNLAMQRAGQNRRALWKAVTSSQEPERRTLMMVICGLEDYDLAHIHASDLEKHVHLAWKARRTYPWCAKTPLEIFQKYVAGPRFFQEQIQDWRSPLTRLARHEVKYCRTTQEVSDRMWKLMNEKVAFNLQESGGGIAPMKILKAGTGGCLELCILHAALARSVGLAERVTRVVWQNSLGEHFCVEVWSNEDQRWHEIDVSAGDRNFANDWVMRVPKAGILAPSGDRGVWDGLGVGRWSSFSNTIKLIYPSGEVSIKVRNHGAPAPDRTVGIKLPTVKGLVYMAMARTDANGEARLTLGESAQYPYLFYVLPPDEAAVAAKYPYPFSRHNFGDETYQWVQVQAGQRQEVVLNLEERRPFDPAAKPPALVKRTK